MVFALQSLCWSKGKLKEKVTKFSISAGTSRTSTLLSVRCHCVPFQQPFLYLMNNTKYAGGGVSVEENSTVKVSMTSLFSCAELFLIDVSVVRTSLK